MTGQPSTTAHAARGSSRRAPRPEERQRDADRTRRRIMEAALGEFSAKGFAGARVAAIAKRAGVNAQLITYYFGGKQGLYDALRETWAAAESTFASPGQPFSAVVRGYLDAALDRPELSRVLVWQALDAPGEPDPAQAEQVRQAVEEIRRRQQAGELTAEFDPETILVTIWAATIAPVSMPRVIRAAFGENLTEPAARARYASQLARLFTSPADEKPGVT